MTNEYMKKRKLNTTNENDNITSLSHLQAQTLFQQQSPIEEKQLKMNLLTTHIDRKKQPIYLNV
jgi:hypothetical protein